LPLLFGWPLLLFPLHVVFLEFVIDPACSLVFEGEQRGEGLMRRPPRDPRAPLFARPMLLEALLLGVASLIGVTLVYAIALRSLSEGQARALGFIALVIGNLMLVLVNRSRGDALGTVLSRPNAAFWWISSLAIVALAIVVSVPAAAEAFRLQPPSPLGVAAAVLVGVMTVAGLAYFRRPRAAAEERR
jgi:Ca2+-transporting ATPase